MPPQRILDTHIHLWPSTAVEPSNHGWMAPGHHLAKQHGLSDYNLVTSSSSPNKSPRVPCIYIETDRYLPSVSPDITAEDNEAEKRRKLEDWAKEPLQELRFLRRIVEKSPQEGDGFTPDEADALKGAVIWAPFHLPSPLFTLYLRIAEEVSGPALWARVVGFRYLLQGKGEGVVQNLVASEEWLGNLVALGKGRGGRGWAFDVGVDVHRDGVEVLECIVGMVREVRRREESAGGQGRVEFVLNHLCKPAISHSPSPTWTTALHTLSTLPSVSLKLSGAFNEFSSATPSSLPSILASLDPYFGTAFAAFKGKLMFGSDWPVCNVGGPRGEDGNWAFWVEIVEAWMEERGVEEGERESVWWRAGGRAYGVEV